MDIEKIVSYWMEASDENYLSMKNIVSKNENHWALFIGHLCIEKLLKAVYVYRNNESSVPFSHNLPRLAELAQLVMDNDMFEKLATITSFNIGARYPDYENRFTKLCTDDFTAMQVKVIEEVRAWLKQQIPESLS